MSGLRNVKWVFGASALAFGLRFVLLFALAETVAALAVQSSRLAPLIDRWDTLNAAISNVVLQWAGTPCTRYGAVLVNGEFALDITPECNGLTVMVLLACAVMAFPSPWMHKVLGCVCGTLILFAANILRIATLVHLGGIRPALVEDLHKNVWPAILIAIAVLCLISWMYLSSRYSSSPSRKRTDDTGTTA